MTSKNHSPGQDCQSYIYGLASDKAVLYLDNLSCS